MRFNAAIVVLAGSLALLAGAYGFEIIGGLVPCEMCWWQRWALMATAFFAADALVMENLAARQPTLKPVATGEQPESVPSKFAAQRSTVSVSLLA